MTQEELKRAAVITESLNQFLVKVSLVSSPRLRGELMGLAECYIEKMNHTFDEIVQVAKAKYGRNILEE